MFLIYFENDDDLECKLGIDFKVYFIVFVDGDYFVCVLDIWGFFGEEFKYWLWFWFFKFDFSILIGN